MIDKLIASDLAALARENRQRIPAFVPPAPRAKAVARVLTWAHVLAVAPTITMLALGGALLAFDCSPFGHYEPFVMPFVVAVASFLGLAMTSTRDPASAAAARAQVACVLASGALVIGTVVYFVVEWPAQPVLVPDTAGDAIYALVGVDGHQFADGPGVIVIAATLAVLIARRIAARPKAAWLGARRDLEAWSTGATIVGALVVVVWANAFAFNAHGWTLASFRLPDPTIRDHLVSYMSAKMWFALTFRPLSESSISDAQWGLAKAAAVVVVVAVLTGVAVGRERTVRRRSLWLRFLELPAILPLFVIIGTANLARATIADGPRDAGSPFAWAVAGVMLAFTSMLLRRRHRREALS